MSDWTDGDEDEDEDEDMLGPSARQRQLLPVGFGHVVWLEHKHAVEDEEDEEPYECG